MGGGVREEGSESEIERVRGRIYFKCFCPTMCKKFAEHG